jgi:LysR family transcriptional regulator, salicylic acid-responsive activator of bsdBCD
MDIRQLKYFLCVAEEEQITAAAKRLNMAQPPLSQQMKLLEDELGIKLFKRGPRQVYLTDAGKILVNRARQILELSDSTLREINDFKRGLKGTLNIGTVSSSGSILLSKGMTKFHEEYRGAKFEIYEGNTFSLIDLLTRGIIEVGIVRTPFKSSHVHCKYLAEEPMIAIMNAPIDWAPGRNEISLEELKDRPLIIYRRFEQLILDTCTEHDFLPKIFCKNDDARTTVLWANAGYGVGIVPASALGLAAHTNLHIKTINEKKLHTRITAIWMKDRYLSSLAEKFLEYF